MCQRILIANRGEIALRILRACRQLGIDAVVAYSEADRESRAVLVADEAICIGPADAKQSYLSAPAVISAALATGCDAIHPGYGFLSENEDFAQACADAGLVFIGPPAAAIRDMGSKAAAKALMEKAGVPLVPGYHGEAQDLETFRQAAERIGYPVLLKAAAGGGGKGLKIVEDEGELAEALRDAFFKTADWMRNQGV